MRVLVTGGAGLVAGRLVRTTPDGVEVHVTERRTPVPDDVRARAGVHVVDLVDTVATTALLDRLRPDVVVHAAYTQADRADIVDATGAVAEAAAAAGAGVVHLSTDVVFAGDDPPYGEADPTDPITDYGRWKVAAETLVRGAVPDAAITRTSLVVSLEPPDRATAGLVDTWGNGGAPRLFHDELRQPIRVEDLAAELWALVALPAAERAGTWHLPGPEKLSRLVIGERLADRLGLGPVPILSATSAEVVPPRPRDPELRPGRRDRLGVPLRAIDD